MLKLIAFISGDKKRRNYIRADKYAGAFYAYPFPVRSYVPFIGVF
jgi:hypothetical protein